MTLPAFNPGSARDLVKDGTWFCDAQGRYVLFRGVNFSGRSKRPPYLPIMPLNVPNLDSNAFAAELAAVQPQLDLLQSMGVNIVRVPVMWKALESSPNQNPEQLLPDAVNYLNFVQRIIDEFYKRGMFVLVDFHQDIAHEHFNGDGFPDWALPNQLPIPLSPAPGDLQDKNWGLNYYDNPIDLDIVPNTDEFVRATLSAFWMNGLVNLPLGLINYPVRTHLEKTIGATARFFQAVNNGAGHPAILGYEAFNEPAQVGIGRDFFESQLLRTYYANVQQEIRNTSPNGQPGDQQSFLFVQPRVDWTTYNTLRPIDIEFQANNFTLTPQTALDTSPLSSERTVFAFHYYDPWTLSYGTLGFSDSMKNKQRDWPGVFQYLMNAATSRGLIPFMTEFGGSQDWQFTTDLPNLYPTQIRAYIDLQFQQIESHLLNAIYWQYDLYNTAVNKDNWNQENFSLLGPNRTPRELDLFARPYPMRSSAKPSLLNYNPPWRQGVIQLAGPVVNAPTVIFIPAALNYPDGFEIRATSANLEWHADSQVLYWYPDGTQSVNQLIISPAFGFNAGILPQSAQNLLPNTPLRLAQPNQCQVVRVDPASIALNTPVQVAVYVEDTVTHAPVVGRASVHNYPPAQPAIVTFATSTPTNVVKSTPITFHSYGQSVNSPHVPGPGGGGGSGGGLLYPTGFVSVSGYLSASIPFDFLDASFASQSVPSSMIIGQSYAVTVTMINTGNRSWAPGGSNPLRLGTQNPQDNTTWGLSRVDIPSAVDAGASVTFSFTIKAPSSAGTYNFQWRMVQESVTWFGDTTLNVQISVAKGKETKDGKEQKDKEKEKERDKLALIENTTPGTSPMTPQPVQDEQESGAQTASRAAFITSEERPNVGGQALIQGPEKQG